MNKQNLNDLNEQARHLSPDDIIQLSAEKFSGQLPMASSLGEEDQVLTDVIAKLNINVSVFTLDTGRLFQETYDLIAKTQARYPDLNFKVFYPDTKAVETMVKTHGMNLFYESVEKRKRCCGVRKVEPLQRALAGASAWFCGLRRGQSLDRSQTQIFEWDESYQNVKISPLAYWSLDQVRDYIQQQSIDVNPLHEKGFVSIGCAPCTRAIESGEDLRSGRWWWEEQSQKECGLHQRLPKKKT